MKRLFKKLASGLLVLLGFSSVGCDKLPVKVEYGTPTAEYSIKGRVTDASQPGAGISGIQMIFVRHPEDTQFDSDTVYTASNGAYNYQNRYLRYGLSSVILKDPNGNFKTDTVQISFSLNEANRKGNWLTAYTKDNLDFALQPGKDPEPEEPTPADE